MTTRAVSLAVCLIGWLALSSGASLASPAPVGFGIGHPPSTAFCPADTSSSRPAISPSTRNRIAFHCRCCGRDENGHCNHQCCD